MFFDIPFYANEMTKNVYKRDLLDKFINDHPDMSRSQVIKANENLGVHMATLYRWYDRKLQLGSTTRFVASGRRVKFATKANIRYIKNYFNNRSGRSQVKCAGNIGCHQTYVGRILKKYTKIRCRMKLKRAY